MKMYIFAFFTLIVMSTANAASIDMSGLTDEQQAQLVLQAAQMKKSGEGLSIATIIKDPETAEAWAKTVGVVIKTTASELGIAVNEFADTFVGKLTIVLVI